MTKMLAGMGCVKALGRDTRPPNLVENISGWQGALAALAVMAALLLNLLFFHRYPAFSPEAGIALAVLAGIALIYGAIYRFASLPVRALLEGVLIATALNTAGVNAPWPIATGLAVAAFVMLRRMSILPFLTVAALVTAGASALGIGQRHEEAFTIAHKSAPHLAALSELPAIVHIILDEHVGIDGMRSENPRMAAVKSELEHFYLGNRFRVYSRAHSDYAYTLNSIPQILNFGQPQEPNRSKADKKKVENVAYFDQLGRRGYRVKVYQSEYLDICSPTPVTDCLTYQSQNIGSVATSSLSLGSKAEIILRKLLSPTLQRLAASAYRGLRRLGMPLPTRDITEIRVNPLNAAIVFDRFNSELASARPGEVYFAHFLLPHSPFGLTPDCRLKEGAWMRRQYPGPLGLRENAGYDQMLCALQKTEATYRAISRSAAGKNFVMVVHGDHGWRMTDSKPLVDQAKVMTDRDKVSNFSAFFAVRAPQISGGMDPSPLSLSELVKGLAQSKFSAPPAGRAKRRSQVYLADDNFIPRAKMDMPVGW